jgi:hypothetical protein
LGELSSDALPYTLRLLNDPNEQTKNNFARDLYWSRQYHYGEEGDKALKNWQSMNLSRTKAEKLLAPQRGILEAHKGDSDSPESL